MKSEYVPRINQLDSLQLDDEITRILREQITKALQNLSPGFLSNFQPELDVIIRILIWQYSIHKKFSSFGQQMLFISYDKDQLNRSKLILHFSLNVLFKYFKDCITFRWTEYEKIQKLITWTDNFLTIAKFINFFRFLKTGKRPSLIDWILGLDFITMHGNLRRDIGYTHMTRELVWTGCMELLAFSLPLINYHSVKRKLKNLVKSLDVNSANGDNSYSSSKVTIKLTTKCSYCNERPTLPHHMGCSHVFCYYCLQANKLSDVNFQCPICDWNGNKIESL